jgi:hypothetical protein
MLINRTLSQFVSCLALGFPGGCPNEIEKSEMAGYLLVPAIGKLAEIDSALIVTSPSGLEAGYVSIVTRQEAGRRVK